MRILDSLITRCVSDARTYPHASVAVQAKALVTRHGPSEIDAEVCALDHDGRIIPGTYLGEIVWQASPPTRRRRVTSGFLFYAEPWTSNFQHFFVELFPKLVDYLAICRRVGETPLLLVPPSLDNLLTREIFETFGLSQAVLVLEPGTLYEVELLFSSGFTPDYGGVSLKLVHSVRLLRKLMQLHRPRPGGATRRVYLARDATPKPERNDNAAGVGRVILNHDQVRTILDRRGFETVALATSTLEEKATRLAGADVVVSPMGANLINYFFLSRPFPRSIVILSSDAYARGGYMARMLNRMLGSRIDFRFVRGKALDPRHINDPYEVDLEQLAGVLDELGAEPRAGGLS